MLEEEDFIKFSDDIYQKIDKTISLEANYCITNNSKYLEEFTNSTNVELSLKNTDICYEAELRGGHIYLRNWIKIRFNIKYKVQNHELGDVSKLPMWLNGNSIIEDYIILDKYTLEDLPKFLKISSEDLNKIILKDIKEKLSEDKKFSFNF